MTSRSAAIFFIACCLVLVAATSARGDTLITATERENSQVVLVNLTTNAITTLCKTGSIHPDSLLLYANNGIVSYIYSGGDIRQVRMCTPLQVTPTIIPCDATAGGQTCDVPLASLPGQSGLLQDMIFDPAAVSTAAGYSGHSLLVSDDLNGITRIDITTPANTPSVLVSSANCLNPQGLAYVNGNLFANCGGFLGTPANNGVYEFNPVTGALINSNKGFDPTGTLDGLIYDPFTGLLYATSQCGGVIYSIDPGIGFLNGDAAGQFQHDDGVQYRRARSGRCHHQWPRISVRARTVATVMSGRMTL